jgi:hypothetical protein
MKMKRTVVALSFVMAALPAFHPAIDACGDKSLSAGGIRWQRAVAARYPASVLAYVPAGSRLSVAKRELKLPDTLRQVGHKYHEVASLSELQASVRTGQFNIVIADLADVATLRPDLESAASRVVLVPVAYKLTKTESSEAAKQSRFLIKAPGRAVYYLETIADAVKFGSASPRKG